MWNNCLRSTFSVLIMVEYFLMCILKQMFLSKPCVSVSNRLHNHSCDTFQSFNFRPLSTLHFCNHVPVLKEVLHWLTLICNQVQLMNVVGDIRDLQKLGIVVLLVDLVIDISKKLIMITNTIGAQYHLCIPK